MPEASPEATCLNCAASLAGRYCHVCGQKATTSLHVSLHDFAHEATHEFLHLDGKIVRTVKRLLTRPGLLTQEFLAGRRAHFISPLRLYLTFSVLFFALAALFPSATKGAIKINVTAADAATAEREAARIASGLMHNLPRTMFVLMPAYALITWLFYRKQQQFYVPHLYYSVHFHAFIFFILSAGVLLTLAGRPGRIIGAILVVTIIPYHFIGLRRVFGGSRGKTIAKGIAIALIYNAIVVAALIAAGLAAYKFR